MAKDPLSLHPNKSSVLTVPLSSIFLDAGDVIPDVRKVDQRTPRQIDEVIGDM
jgi:hypothetical protein